MRQSSQSTLPGTSTVSHFLHDLDEFRHRSPRHNRFMADALPDAELVILDGLKHAILIEAPDRVASHVRDFLLRYRDRT